MKRAILALLLAGCGGGTGGRDLRPLDLAGGDGMSDPADPRRCGPGVMAVPDEGAAHVDPPTSVTYKNNPPASGTHWTRWHDWGVFRDPVPREEWVHNLEHGGIVLAFNCPEMDAGTPSDDGGAAWPCPEVTLPLRRIFAERPPDRHGKVRLLVTPDPLLPRRVAAVAWGFALVADRVDEVEVRCFIDARYARGPEDVP